MTYLLLRDIHFFFSRAALIIAVLMLLYALYVGLLRHGDVSKAFRRGVYVIFGMIMLEGLIGLAMYAIGGRPLEDVHLIYGMGAMLALPFFIFVETTAKKRPAMGSYMWGFGVLAGIVIRSIMTGR
jgi:hypothetical protein